ncbi:CheR family methyltransferase [Sinanaerobacter chloroacetimidivorans]|jgi:chemotaxis protein methyltransferase CheR|uniref:protein-glutamate O-methyltransferase n=1 Tax=Sinanaerobacter chloroacetimidivorans TaxID=2818044 RepID=A0A8J7W1Q3_9FIRM|nr:protein-glutamate O-methyltransferase CheR [Sinanaerobacter chloroacetimidivorans]MBR0597511.1 protein-glutamate O-methyltransferase CheR [Sinanaerobacter chloroacetimidivorans]
MIYLKDDEFKTITSYIKTHYGVNLTQKRPLIEGRLSNYISDLGFDNYMDYFEYAKNDRVNDEMTMLINKLTTNHTYFFRENEHFEFYKDIVLPWVDKTLKVRDLRVWSAGCSSGQEPYTLSMITQEYLGSAAQEWDSTILASDISNKVLTIAKNGIYSREELSDVPHSWIKKYFRAHDEQRFVVSENLRKNVAYRNFNLLSPFEFKKPFQAIFCRNVMIYFDMPTKNEIINKFYDVLLPGGYFFIGHSESLSACDHKFKYIKPSIYQKGY